MKKILLFLCLLPLIALQAQDTTETKDRIFWSNWYELEWADFQGEASDINKIAALSNLAIPYSYTSDGEGSMRIFIQTCFIKTSSWSKEDQQNNVLLLHEQLHFDVAELYRRKIVKKIMESKFTKENYADELKNIITDIWTNDYRKAQDKYDKETNYSRIFGKQIDWNAQVAKELDDYKEYASTEIEVNLINFD